MTYGPRVQEQYSRIFKVFKNRPNKTCGKFKGVQSALSGPYPSRFSAKFTWSIAEYLVSFKQLKNQQETYVVQSTKVFVKDYFSKCRYLQKNVRLLTFTKHILNGKLHFCEEILTAV